MEYHFNQTPFGRMGNLSRRFHIDYATFTRPPGESRRVQRNRSLHPPAYVMGGPENIMGSRMQVTEWLDLELVPIRTQFPKRHNSRVAPVAKKEKSSAGSGDEARPTETSDSYHCPICSVKFCCPTATKCGHVFCKDCILGVLNKDSNSRNCPLCRMIVNHSDLRRIYL